MSYDEKLTKIQEFVKAFEGLLQEQGWRLHQLSTQDDCDGFFLQVTLMWEKPSEGPAIL